jgi:hypothetical protein
MMLMCFASVLLIAAPGSANGIKPPNPVPMHPDTSAPDAWGYTWVKSTDPGGPTFRWIDISTRGTLVSGLGDDNSVGPFPIQWNFQYYWYQVTNFRIGSNGYITFGNQSANFASPFAAQPNTTPPNDMLAICTGDLDFTVTAANPSCYFWSNGVDSLVVSYINVTEWQQTTNPNLKHTFQVILSGRDSTIVYQYGVQQGRYNSTNNVYLSIGIENQTGQIGLSYGYSTAPPHAFMPDTGLAIRIKRTVNTGLSIIDAGILGGYNAENLGKIVRFNVADTVKALVRNFGTASLSNIRARYAISKTGTTTVYDTVFVASLSPNTSTTVSFPRLFTPTATGSYTGLFEAFVANDVGPGNNTKTNDIASANISPTTSTQLAFDGGTIGGSIGWLGGGGFAVDFAAPVPVRVDSVYVGVGTITANPMTVEIREGSSGSPGALLATKDVTAVVGNNGLSFVADSVKVASGHFFVGARGQINFNYETNPPISNRSWEYTNGYAPYRSRDLQDVMIRAAVRQFGPTGVEETPGLPERFELTQNYPNPFNPSTQIRFALPAQSKVTLAIFDILGRQIRTIVNNESKPAGVYNVEWDGRNSNGIIMPSGTYFMRLQSGTYSETKKLMLLK